MDQSSKRKRGKRAGRSNRAAELRDIHSKVRGVSVHRSAQSNFHATVTEKAIYFDTVDGLNVETVEDHIVPRHSLTRKQLLMVFPQKVETVEIPGKQLDKRTGKLVEVNDNRIVWKSDRSLLQRLPTADKIGTFKRDGKIIEGLNTRHNRTTENEDLPLILESASDDDQL